MSIVYIYKKEKEITIKLVNNEDYVEIYIEWVEKYARQNPERLIIVAKKR